MPTLDFFIKQPSKEEEQIKYLAFEVHLETGSLAMITLIIISSIISETSSLLL